MTEPYTIVVDPQQWDWAHIYRAYASPFGNGVEKYGLTINDIALLPEEVVNEVRVSKGRIYMMGFRPPIVSHYLGWEYLETELRRMAATNQSPDGLFDGCTLEITFTIRQVEPRPGSSYDTPLVVVPISHVKIIKGPEPLT